MSKNRILEILQQQDRAGLWPCPDRVRPFNRVCNILQPRPFSLGSIPGFVDSHNVPAPSVPNRHDSRESILSPRFLEPIHESLPSGPEHIPPEVGNSDGRALEIQKLEGEGEQPIGRLMRVLSISPWILPRQGG